MDLYCNYYLEGGFFWGLFFNYFCFYFYFHLVEVIFLHLGNTSDIKKRQGFERSVK